MQYEDYKDLKTGKHCSYCKKPIRNLHWFNIFLASSTYQCDRLWCRFKTGHLFKLGPFSETYFKVIGYPKRWELLFKWYNFYMGFYIDTKNKNLYFFPMPMIGIRICYAK